MNLRQVTACPQLAEYTTFRRRKRALVWQIYTCRPHRHLPDWSVPGNLRRLGADEEHPECGTVYDHRPPAEVIVSHLRGWMGAAGYPSGSPEPDPDDWQTHLDNARSFYTHVRDADLLAVIDRAFASEGPTTDTLAVLADAETAAARQRRR
ncbi:hypothetical protein ACFYMW_36025 [Streptomyces sp. NPDC006692]|uniref:hypothetical protein n=1 Tax=unclassified Streptomyces TaxID=2593676 RepID=UPI0034284B55